MDSAKESVIESLDLRAGGGGDVECPDGAHGHPPNIDTLLCAGRDGCTRNVAGLKAKVALLALAVPDREAVPVESRHLAISVAGGRDQQRAHPSGVLSPTQAASCQRAFSSPRRVRLNLVRPPVPTSTGRPVATSR